MGKILLQCRNLSGNGSSDIRNRVLLPMPLKTILNCVMAFSPDDRRIVAPRYFHPSLKSTQKAAFACLMIIAARMFWARRGKHIFLIPIVNIIMEFKQMMKTMRIKLSCALVALGISFSATQAQAGKLMLYTSQPEADAAKTVELFQKLNPDIEVQIYRSGTSDILGKLAAEFSANAPQADILLIADAVSMEGLKAQNRLLAYPQANVDGFAPETYDKDHTYFGSKLITTGIAYNSAAVVKPQHWADLVQADYKGKVVMPSPLYSGAAAYLLSGFVENEALGWDYFSRLQANELISVRGNGAVLKSVASGEKPYGILVDFMALNAKAKGSPIEFVFPPEGVPAVTEPVAIMAHTQNVADAQKFVDFILSDEGQKLSLEQGYLPAKASVGRPSWLSGEGEVKIMPIDTSKILQHIESDKARFADMFGG